MDSSVTSIVAQFDPRLAAVLGWLILMSKLGVDWLKTATTLPRWAPPAICFAAMTGLLLLVMLALAIPITLQLVAQAVLMSVIGTAVAIGSTVLQSRTNPSTDTSTATAIVDEIQKRIQASDALQAPPSDIGARGRDDRAVWDRKPPQNTRPTETAI